MRKIKFRAWDTLNKKYFSPTFDAYKGDLEELHIGMSGDVCLRRMDGMHHESTFPNRFTLEQFTGLHDKNGVEVYEGDIMSDNYMSSDNSMGILPNGWMFDETEDLFVVVWDKEIACWTFKFDDATPKDIQEEFGDYASAYMSKWKQHARHILLGGTDGIGKVIGNIHENKDLLNKETL